MPFIVPTPGLEENLITTRREGGKRKKTLLKGRNLQQVQAREVGHLPPLVGGGEGRAKRAKKRTDTQQTIKHWVNWWRTSNNRSGTSWRHMQKTKVRGEKDASLKRYKSTESEGS